MSKERLADLMMAQMTLDIARRAGMDKHPRPASGTCSTHFHHLEGMLDTLTKDETMDAGKRGRFIGWMQCAVVVAGCATMEQFREVNKAILALSTAVDKPPVSGVEKITLEFDRDNMTTDQKIAAGLGVRGANGQYIDERDW